MVDIEKRHVKVGLTGCWMALGQKKKSDYKLIGQRVYVQLPGMYNPTAMFAVEISLSVRADAIAAGILVAPKGIVISHLG